MTAIRGTRAGVLEEAVLYLRDLATIRERCDRLLAYGIEGQLEHFEVHLDRLPVAAVRTATVTRRRYPDLKVPIHGRLRHFDVGGVPRLSDLERRTDDQDPCERARALCDMVVVSVLLDAGSGPRWRYHESETGQTLARSEGLAVASMRWIAAGGLSSHGLPYQVDAEGLLAVTTERLGRAFQVSADNPLAGLGGRAGLLQALGEALTKRADVFGEEGRIGGLVDFFQARAEEGGVHANTVLDALLEGLGSIWPGGPALAGVPLGDVWRHPRAGGTGPGAGFVPFHKLSQWLTYSMIEPLQVAGLQVSGVSALTGLAEYRNGGLLIDTGVVCPRDETATRVSHRVDAELIVEWRALTVALLDRMVPLVQAELGVAADALPLSSILEGGTWEAGREIAKELRPDGGPPIRIDSDGTVF
ncbi:MAG: URC4/urg3 family protein [Myxococcales bacterium]|nr:URC4/urg3 family protein [Myxococcales bacterium]